MDNSDQTGLNIFTKLTINLQWSNKKVTLYTTLWLKNKRAINRDSTLE